MLSSEEMNTGSTSTAFLNKLWKIVNDPHTDNLIKWSETGYSFIITDQTKFTQQLIPRYFKHNNMASFIRQLNMYGFHKVTSVEAGGLVPDKDEIEFSHPQFLKGQRNLIVHIKRKPQGTRAVINQESAHNLPVILVEVEKMKKNQESIESKLLGVKKENELLWREYANVRQRFAKQQQIIEKLVQFLVALVKSPGPPIGQKRKYNHLALEGAEGGGRATSSGLTGKETSSIEFEPNSRLQIRGPVIHDVTTLAGQAEPLVLEKVFDSHTSDQSRKKSGSSMATVSPGNSLRGGEHSGKRGAFRGKKMKAIVKREKPDQMFEYGDISSNECLDQTGNLDENNFLQNGVLHNPATADSTNVSYSSPIVAQMEPNNRNINYNTSDVGNLVMVESPNGTVLETLNTSLDSETDAELMRSIDPALVSPHVMAIPNQINELLATSYAPVPTPQYPMGNVTRQNSNSGKLLGSSMQVTNLAPQKRVSDGKMRRGKLPYKGKNIGKNVPTYTTAATLESDSPAGNSNYALSVPSFDLAVAEKQPYENDELVNNIDDMQLSLDSLQDILNSSNFNIDTSTILSLFGNEEPFGPHNDLPVSNQDQADNQLSVYNPSLIDLIDEQVSSLRERDEQGESSKSSPKLPRLNVKKEIPKNSDDDDLNTPHPNLEPSSFYS